MKNCLLGFLLFFSCFISAQDEIDLRSVKALQHFIAVDEQNHADYDVMFTIFTSMDIDVKKLLSTIKNDIIRCRRYIRLHRDHAHEHRVLLKQLCSFYNYVKKYKHCCAAIQFHNDVKSRYALAFNNPKVVSCVNETPHLYGISEKCKHKSKAYFNQVLLDLSKISKFEDYLHGDLSTLKAHNYVLKIELIKVRNSVYHNNVYKYETSYF